MAQTRRMLYRVDQVVEETTGAERIEEIPRGWHPMLLVEGSDSVALKVFSGRLVVEQGTGNSVPIDPNVEWLGPPTDDDPKPAVSPARPFWSIFSWELIIAIAVTLLVVLYFFDYGLGSLKTWIGIVILISLWGSFGMAVRSYYQEQKGKAT